MRGTNIRSRSDIWLPKGHCSQSHRKIVSGCSARVSRRQELTAIAGLLPAAAVRSAKATPSTCTLTVSIDYDKFAKSYDLLDDGAIARSLGFPGLRTALLSRAKGSVLETGIGTGALHNLSRHSVCSLFFKF
jgi:hypothetical protein